jgi:hypothetical protein
LSPILVRPVREQLEHDRVIRLLQAKYKRKFEVAINPGNERSAPVGPPGTVPWYPDLVLQSPEKSRKLLGVVEVETAESVNNLEAMSQWVALAKLRAPFHLYVPSGSIDTARRLCADLNVPVAEVWAYHWLGDQMRFTLVHRADGVKAERAAAEPKAKPAPKPALKPAAKSSGNGKAPAARAARPAVRPKAGQGKAASATARRKPVAAKSRTSASSRPRAAAKTTARPRAAAKKTASRAQKRK